MKTTQLTNGKLGKFMETLPYRLLALRKAHGLTQKETGELIGVSSFAVCQWENGAIPNSPNRQRLQELFEEYEVQEAGPKPKADNYVDPDEPKEFVVERPHGQRPLRFKGERLGGRSLSDGGFISMWRTAGGNLVWRTDGLTEYGSEADFFEWTEEHNMDRGLCREIREAASAWGVALYEDIA